MVEYSIRRDDTIFIHRPASKGENVMKAGSDIHKGEKILRKGQRLASREIGVLAALGLTEVDVYKRPRVAVISTGAEIVGPGKPLPLGKIYDINAHTLSAAVLECGGKPINLGIIPDERDQLEAAVKKALNSADAVITSGGVSVGPKDIIPQVLDTLGKPGVIISGIAVKPGKPTTIAMIKGKPVFSLPGHPTSSLLMFHMIARPVICKMAGRKEDSPVVKAVAATKMFPARGRRTFVMVNLTHDKAGRLLASPVPTGLSGAITTLAKASGFVEIEEKKQFINEGEEVTVYLFQGKKS
jgi:putative molybdopterin biosynthesis protein